jgi:hypothetical protein
MHPAAIGECLTFDPTEDFAAFVVRAEPPWRRVETDALQVKQEVADALSIWSRWSADSAPDSDDAFGQRAAGQLRLVVSRG